MDEMQMLREYRDARPGPSPKAVAEARARLDGRARKPRGLSPVWRRRYLLGAAAAGVAVVVTVPLGVLGGEPGDDRAYAAVRLPDGRIKVTMDDLTGRPGDVQHRLDGIERRLAALGVDAVIDFTPASTRCSTFPRGELDQEANSRANAVDDGWLLPNRDKRAVFYVHPERIKPGNSLVWTISLSRSGRMTAVGTQSYQVRGPVKPCRPVPLDYRGPIPSGPTRH
jgi:hypothetical protein